MRQQTTNKQTRPDGMGSRNTPVAGTKADRKGLRVEMIVSGQYRDIKGQYERVRGQVVGFTSDDDVIIEAKGNVYWIQAKNVFK